MPSRASSSNKSQRLTTCWILGGTQCRVQEDSAGWVAVAGSLTFPPPPLQIWAPSTMRTDWPSVTTFPRLLSQLFTQRAQVRQISQLLHRPQLIFSDITHEDFRAAPTTDVFFGGFPCQPYAAQGHHQGLTDAQGRGVVLVYMLRYIKERRPKTFVLENAA